MKLYMVIIGHLLDLTCTTLTPRHRWKVQEADGAEAPWPETMEAEVLFKVCWKLSVAGDFRRVFLLGPMTLRFHLI